VKNEHSYKAVWIIFFQLCPSVAGNIPWRCPGEWNLCWQWQLHFVLPHWDWTPYRCTRSRWSV